MLSVGQHEFFLNMLRDVPEVTTLELGNLTRYGKVDEPEYKKILALIYQHKTYELIRELIKLGAKKKE